MTEEQQFDSEICDNKNKNSVQCQFCSSVILKQNSAKFIECEFPLPLMHQKNSRKIDEVETEKLTKYWSVDDMFTFENIGFSHTVDATKFLVCADCEMGPVGYHDTISKKSYVALKRVKHV